MTSSSKSLRQVIVNSAPDPENSWILYQCSTRLMSEDRVIRHKPLDGKAVTQDSSPSADYPVDLMMRATGGTDAGVKSASRDIIQRIGSPSFKVQLVGRALRIGHRIPPPRLISVGGIPAVEIDQDVEEGTLQSIGTVPIYFSRWCITYMLAGSPSGTPLVANPAFQTEGA